MVVVRALALGTRILCWLVVAATLPWGCRSESGRDWPQWRGRGGLGVSSERGLPVTWTAEGPSIQWKTAIPGVGNSSPVVSGRRVYLTAGYPIEEGTRRPDYWRVVLALDSRSGKILWESKLYNAPQAQDILHRVNTVATPTPVTDGKHVFVYFGSVLASLDQDGNVVWQEVIDPDFSQYARHGAASSPVLVADKVIVAQDREYGRTSDVGWLAAFDKSSGRRLWRTEWTHTCCSYSTPLVVRRGTKAEILLAHTGGIASYDPGTGEKLWSADYPINQIVSSPVVDGDLLGVAGGAHNVRHTVFFALSGTGQETRAELVWSNPRYAPHISSPVLYDGLFFSVTGQGVLTCYDARTGELHWVERLSQGRYRSSILAGDGKIYVSSTDGQVSVVAASPEFRLLAQNTLGERGNGASPAVGDGCLLIRTQHHLFCIEGA